MGQVGYNGGWLIDWIIRWWLDDWTVLLWWNRHAFDKNKKGWGFTSQPKKKLFIYFLSLSFILTDQEFLQNINEMELWRIICDTYSIIVYYSLMSLLWQSQLQEYLIPAPSSPSDRHKKSGLSHFPTANTRGEHTIQSLLFKSQSRHSCLKKVKRTEGPPASPT